MNYVVQNRPLGSKLAMGVTMLDIDQMFCWDMYAIRADSRFAPSQWERALLCNDVSHWLGASLESAPCYETDGDQSRRLFHNVYLVTADV